MSSYLDIKKLKMLYKEIEVIKDDFDSLIYTIKANSGSIAEIERLEKEKDKAIKRYTQKYNDFNNELDKIEDNIVREILRLRLKGDTYEKIGDKIGYTPSAVYRKEKDFILNPTKYTCKKEIKAPIKKPKTYPIFEMLKDIERAK